MPPFASDRVGADKNTLFECDPTTDAGPKDHPKHGAATRRGSIPCLGQRKAIRVVGEPHRAGEGGFQILLQRPPVEPDRVGIFDQPGGG